MIRLAAISDPHLPGPGSELGSAWHNRLEFETALPRLRRAVELIRAEAVDGLVVLGDIADVGDPKAFDRAIDACAEAGLETWLVPGNHDTKGPEGGESLAAAVERFGASHVRVPAYGGLAWQGLTLAGIPLLAKDHGTRLDPAAFGPIGGDQPDRAPLVCLTHFPVRSLELEFAAAGFEYAGDLVERAEIERDLAARTAPAIVLSGHLHGRHSGAGGRLLQVSCGPLIEPPFEITFISIEQSGADVAVDVRCEAVAESGAARLPILSPDSGHWEWAGSDWAQNA